MYTCHLTAAISSSRSTSPADLVHLGRPPRPPLPPFPLRIFCANLCSCTARRELRLGSSAVASSIAFNGGTASRSAVSTDALLTGDSASWCCPSVCSRCAPKRVARRESTTSLRMASGIDCSCTSGCVSAPAETPPLRAGGRAWRCQTRHHGPCGPRDAHSCERNACGPGEMWRDHAERRRLWRHVSCNAL